MSTFIYPITEDDLQIFGSVYANKAQIGIGVKIEKNVTVGSAEKPIDNLIIGDHVFIGHDVKLQANNLFIGDYTKIHNHTMLYGRGNAEIGFNNWFGQNCILDCEGGLHFGNGLGVGAYSQLWSHIRHGDTLIGNQYCSFGKLITEEDVWFVGHCIVSPILAKKKSMALVGSVITKDMEENHLYGGTPAKDLTDKLGPPFEDITPEERLDMLQTRINIFYDQHPEFTRDRLRAVLEFDGGEPGQFNVVTRTYLKRNSQDEITLMKYLLPEAKFIPEGITYV